MALKHKSLGRSGSNRSSTTNTTDNEQTSPPTRGSSKDSRMNQQTMKDSLSSNQTQQGYSLMPNGTQKQNEKQDPKIEDIKLHLNKTDAEKVQEVLEELNKKHAVVHIDQFSILTEKGSDFTLEGRQSFINMYEHQTVDILGRPRTKANIWLKHAARRQYEGMVFDPTTTEHVDGKYNIWKGFSVKPKKGSCALYVNHIREVICGGNENYFEYVMNWLAHLIQKPDQLSPALVLMGGQGTGKNTFVNSIGDLFGSQHYLPLDNINQLLGNFNFFQKSAVLIHANEACWGGNKQSLGKLKAMITEEYCITEGKGKDQIRMKNFKHLILSSNEDWPVLMERDARRFLVLSVADKHKGDDRYFGALRSEISNKGFLQALLYDLMHIDITAFKPWELPENREAFEVKLRSESSSVNYIFEALDQGNFDLGNACTSSAWRCEILVSSVYLDYSIWCERQSIRKEDAREFGKNLADLISVEKIRLQIDGQRQYFYRLKSLEESRQRFNESFNQDSSVWLDQ